MEVIPGPEWRVLGNVANDLGQKLEDTCIELGMKPTRGIVILMMLLGKFCGRQATDEVDSIGALEAVVTNEFLVATFDSAFEAGRAERNAPHDRESTKTTKSKG